MCVSGKGGIKQGHEACRICTGLVFAGQNGKAGKGAPKIPLPYPSVSPSPTPPTPNQLQLFEFPWGGDEAVAPPLPSAIDLCEGIKGRIFVPWQNAERLSVRTAELEKEAGER